LALFPNELSLKLRKYYFIGFDFVNETPNFSHTDSILLNLQNDIDFQLLTLCLHPVAAITNYGRGDNPRDSTITL
jgi:hypothetical protein